jgi:hypothetical protein
LEKAPLLGSLPPRRPGGKNPSPAPPPPPPSSPSPRPPLRRLLTKPTMPMRGAAGICSRSFSRGGWRRAARWGAGFRRCLPPSPLLQLGLAGVGLRELGWGLPTTSVAGFLDPGRWPLEGAASIQRRAASVGCCRMFPRLRGQQVGGGCGMCGGLLTSGQV